MSVLGEGNTMNIEKVIEGLETLEVRLRGMDKRICDRALLPIAISLLRTHPDAQPNEPLTLDELREMYEPVWVSVPRLKNGGYWCLCNGGTIIPPSCQEFDARDIKHWVFYRRPPKEAKHEKTT